MAVSFLHIPSSLCRQALALQFPMPVRCRIVKNRSTVYRYINNNAIPEIKAVQQLKMIGALKVEIELIKKELKPIR
jgi:hypothetical protein